MRTAQLGAVIAVAAISGAVVFGDSVDRLVGAPALWGQTWDVEVGGYDEPNGSAAGANALRSNGDVAAFSGVSCYWRGQARSRSRPLRALLR